MVRNLIKLYGENSVQSSYADTVGITTFDEANQQGFIDYLPDAISATVTEEINGQYDFVMTYPVTGAGYSGLEINRIIACKPNPHSSIQAFRIYKITKPLDGVVEVLANHISYDLNGYILNPFTLAPSSGHPAGFTPKEVIQAFKTHSSTPCPFTFSSDVNKIVSKFAVSKPISIREMLGGNLSNELSLIQTTSGEFEFNNTKVYLKQNRGSNNGVRISYAKNLTEFSYDEDSTPFYTGVYPYWSTSRKPDEKEANPTVVVPTTPSDQTFEASAEYGNMNLVLHVSKGSTSNNLTTLNWNLCFKITIPGGYHFRYQNSCEVSINGVKKFSTGNVGEIDISNHNTYVEGYEFSIASGTAEVASDLKSVPVSAVFIQRQDTRGTWKISGNFAMDGNVEVVTNVATDDIYYTVTLDGTKTHDYETGSKIQKLYALDLSKEIEQAKNKKGQPGYDPTKREGELLYPGVTPAQLSAAFTEYLSKNTPPTVFSDSLEISFVDLSQSDEYSDYVGLETVNIGDIVTVDFPLYNVSKAKECVKTEYNVLTNSYINLTLGEITDTLASTIQNGTNMAVRNTVNAEQLANSVNANFNNINALNITATNIQADYVVVNERLTANEASIVSLTADYGSFKSLTTSNFTAVYASISSLSADYGSFKSLTASSINAAYARISSIEADYVSTSYLTANYITASSIAASYATITSLNAAAARISSIEADYVSTSYLTAHYITASSIAASYATITSLNAATARISSIEADYISASYLTANYITASSIAATYASLVYLSNYYAKIDFANIGDAAISKLTAMSAFVNYLSANYADISFARVGSIDAQTLVLKTGYIEEVTISGATVTNLASIVNLNADYINAGTLNAERIRLRGEDGLYYLLNISADGSVTPTDPAEKAKLEGGIDGTIIIAQSITANKIKVTDLYAFHAGIADLIIDGTEQADGTVTNGSIHTVNKTTVDNSSEGIFISPTSMAIGNGTNYLKYKDGALSISGTIFANDGWIAGWHIVPMQIKREVTYAPGTDWAGNMYSVYMNSIDDQYWNGTYNSPHGRDPGDIDAFCVYTKASGETGKYKFRVRYDGTIVCAKAYIGGTNATSTNGWLIEDGKIRYGTLGANSSVFIDAFGSMTATINGSSRSNLMVTVGSLFGLDNTGKLYAGGVVVSGMIVASTGYIGGATGWVIGTGKIYTGTAGSTSGFYLDATGGTSATIAGASRSNLMMTVGSSFGVDTSGKIYANAGYIGGWELDTSQIHKWTNGREEGTPALGTSTRHFYLSSAGTNAISLATSTYETRNGTTQWYVDRHFLLTWAGKLTATNVDITGKVTATSGSFSGSLNAATGTFAGSLSAATGTFAGSLSAATGTFTGSITVTGTNPANRIHIGSGQILIQNSSGTTKGRLYWAQNTYVTLTHDVGAELLLGTNSGTVTVGASATSLNLGNSGTGTINIGGGTSSSCNVYIGAAVNKTASSGTVLYITSSGLLGKTTSSKRYKKDIVPVRDSKMFDGLLSLQVKEFKYKTLSKDDPWYETYIPGLIAEEVEEVYPMGVFHNEDGLPEDIRDRNILIGTLALLQKLYKRVDELERKLASYDK